MYYIHFGTLRAIEFAVDTPTRVYRSVLKTKKQKKQEQRRI